MSAIATLVALHDLDQLVLTMSDPGARGRWRRMGLGLGDPAALAPDRERLAAGVDRAWRALYERGLERYGVGLTLVRGRVCQGCFVVLPMSQAPPPGAPCLHLCQGCGRLLLWS